MSGDKNQEIQNELIEAIRSDSLSASLRPQAERLLSRITDPVRLTVLGLPGSGKSTLANLLLGRSVLPPNSGLPTVQITLGDTEKSTLTLPNGSKQVFDHCDHEKIAELKPILLEMEMPLPALGRISVMEVVASGSASEQRRALIWASKQTDIALWCTQEFDEMEQDLWSGMPEHLKDHAFLLITKADILALQGLLRGTQMRLDASGAEEFKEILSIETKDAVNARAADGSIDRQKMTETGGRALVAAILRDVEQGKQVAFDQADILLRQHNQFMVPPMPSKKAEAAEPKEAAVVPTKEDIPPQVEKVAPVEEAQDEKVAPVEEAATALAKPEPLKIEQLFSQNRAAYEHAVTFLADSGRAMTKEIAKQDSSANEQVMKKSSEAVIWLDNYLQENGDAADPLLTKMQDVTADASDLVQLLELEDSSRAPMDAISLMVQLKRDLESKLCA